MDSPNVLLVVLDSVRVKNTSLHGHGNQTTPYLEELATESRVYNQARAPSIHSVSSHASIFTGYHVPEHGVTAHESRLDPKSTIWSELATEKGYTTGLFSPNVVLTRSSNLADAFDTVDGPRGAVRYRLFEEALSPMDIEGHQTNREYLKRCFASDKPIRAVLNGLFFLYGGTGGSEKDESGSVYVNSFLEWSKSVDEPWAACVNLMDAHYPYLPQPEFDKWGSDELRKIHRNTDSPQSESITVSDDWWKLQAFESLYDGGIHQADAAIKHLVETLRDRQELEDTLVVITSDHGEGFGEWSRVNPSVRMVDHSWGVHEVLTHVPLVVRPPGGNSGKRDNSLASLTNFPEVVRKVVAGDDPEPRFTVDKYALASTRRLEDPEKVLPATVDNRQKYSGPWRVVYETGGDGVIRKHVEQGTNKISFNVSGTYAGAANTQSTDRLIEKIYGELESANVRLDTHESNTLGEDVENQLEELGYLR
jgi:arylsulfatase A-like enzyme